MEGLMKQRGEVDAIDRMYEFLISKKLEGLEEERATYAAVTLLPAHPGRADEGAAAQQTVEQQ